MNSNDKKRPANTVTNRSAQNRKPRNLQSAQSVQRKSRPMQSASGSQGQTRRQMNPGTNQRRTTPMQSADTMQRNGAQYTSKSVGQQKPLSQNTSRSRASKRQAPPRRLTHGELRRRRRRRNLLLALLTVIVIGIGVALSLTVLFKVENFRVENLDKSTPANTGIYTEDEVLSALRISVGDNMFQFSAKAKQDAMQIALPYLEVVQIRRSLPSTIVVRVQPAVETWSMQTEYGWLILSDGLNIMKITDQKPENLTALTGLSVNTPVEGYSLKLENEQKKVDLLYLIETLEKYGMKDGCTEIALGQENDIYVIYQNRAKILIGTLNNLDYKIQFAAAIMQNKDGKGVAESERGTLDVSHQLEDGSLRPTWSPGDFTVTEVATEPEETPEEQTGESQEPTTDTPTEDAATDEGQTDAQEGENAQQTQEEPVQNTTDELTDEGLTIAD